jgi:pyridoxamine 5'-phosphate oxidase family protein
MFTEIEYRYLSSHRYGRLASIGPDGAPQIHPVAFVIDPVTDCIEILTAAGTVMISDRYSASRRDIEIGYSYI